MNKTTGSKKLTTRGGRERLNAFPPQITMPIVIGVHARFMLANASSFNLDFTDILDNLFVATSATAGYRLASAVRFRSLELWAVAPNVDSPVTISCDLIGGSAGVRGSSQRRSDTSMGFAKPAHLKVKPSLDQQISQWQTGSGTLASLTVPKGCVVDLKYSIVLQDTAGVTAVAGAVSGATVGQLYRRPLDAQAGTPVWIPVAYVSA